MPLASHLEEMSPIAAQQPNRLVTEGADLISTELMLKTDKELEHVAPCAKEHHSSQPTADSAA